MSYLGHTKYLPYMTNRRIAVFILVLAVSAFAVLFAGSQTAYASTFETSDNVHISSLHRIEDDLYVAFPQELLVDGTVVGDLTAGCYHADIKGIVEGSANIGGRYIDHSGRIDGSLRFMGDRLTVNGSVGRSIIGFANQITLEQGAVIERDVSIVGNDVNLNGVIKGDVECHATVVRLAGLIEGNVRLESPKVTIVPPAIIRGNLTYTSDKQDALDTTISGVTIVGDVTWKPIEHPADSESNIITEVAVEISSILAAFLFGIIVMRLFKPYAQESFTQLRKGSVVSLAAGLLGFLVLVFCVLLLIFALASSVVGSILMAKQPAAGAIILAFSILMIPITSFISISGLIILYSAKILVALMIGYPILRLMRPETKQLSKLALLLGLVIISLLCAVPYLGWLFLIIVILAGSGAILLGIKNCRKEPPLVEPPGGK